MTLIDLSGQKFHRLTVLPFYNKDKSGNIRWYCLCDCGNLTTVRSFSLRSEETKSCGCYNKERMPEQNRRLHTKHGHKKKGKETKIYKAWEKMNERCNNPKSKGYYNYGGRGITICDRWKKFENFLEDMGEPPTISHSIDRIDNNGNYCPENCRWATKIEQANNTRINIFINDNGIKLTMANYCRKYNLNYKRFHILYRTQGLSLKEATRQCKSGFIERSKPKR